MMVKEVTYRRDGFIVMGIAVYSYRRGWIGQWMVGDVPLADLEAA